ncbi:PD-(D/E)XK nuclease family protein [Flavobacterium sp.]|uniref:PD-(D/E)XK nuclease family protein n=1 Tax=Flavobacterium sp. TaxID=239 RepID=UPI00262883A8|nr:PD-(D/E)XK nuclease family protein [Flavobacterium sp.]MDD3003684.1 PD-(D/E)XK nuclease family protein [Flavobacterium sp.]
MENNSFLSQLATKILQDNSIETQDLIVILPNKRAKVFLLEALKNNSNQTLLAPQIISIEEFIQQIAQIRTVDAVELIFEFYTVYRSLASSTNNPESFESFANWGNTLLQDFNEIDRYLLKPEYVFSYLKDIEDIKHWSLDLEKRTALIEKYLKFWDLLPEYYTTLYQHLIKKGIGYQGLIYREAVENLNHFSNIISTKKYLFAGFNALNAAEEKIVQHLLALDQAEIVWDVDQVFMNDFQHDAGLFLRRFKKNWNHYKTNPFQWIANDYSLAKKIKVIGTPKSIGQAKIAGKIVENILNEAPESIHKTAVVLGEESLLLPLLHSLPESVPSMNITMGYSAKNNPAQLLLAKLFKLHIHAIKRNPNSYVFYYKDLMDILTHPLVEPYSNTSTLTNIINQSNYTFITHKKVMELQQDKNVFFELLFKQWHSKPLEILENLAAILLVVKDNLDKNNQEEKITNAFVFSIYKVINKLITYYTNYNEIDDLNTLHAIYKQIIDVAEVSFEGEPLSGLQVMGVLESRVLDFENVIITSMNEGKFPAGKAVNSFIPYDLKKEMGLPTFKEKDAIYTFHFYHLLQRAKNIFLIYNTESEGLDGGEKSRFITQLEIEKQSMHEVSHEIYNSEVPQKAYEPMKIEKSESVMERLSEIAQKGFSPSALTSYIRNPIQFYFQKIISLKEVEEVEENIAVNTLGTIIHETLLALYRPFIGKTLKTVDIQNLFPQIETEVLKQFKIIYKEGEIQKGRNLLVFEVAKRNIFNFLNVELEGLKNGDLVTILHLEERFERTFEHPLLPFSVLIGGSVDRIEERNGIIRIIDYKTGKVEQPSLTLKTWNELTKEIKNDKIIQILAYAFMFQNNAKDKPIEVGIISFKNLKNGFLPFKFKEDKVETTIIDAEIVEHYLNELLELLLEILNPTIAFEEKLI